MNHPSSLVHAHAKIHPSASIGPWCIVEEDVEIGENVVLECRVRVCSGTRIGSNTIVYDGAVLGAPPQDLKYHGERTFLEIGSSCTIREYCTLNRGTVATGRTVIGDDSLIMAYSHVGHDCILGTGAVLANGVQLGGHVCVGSFATIGGNTGVHQFCRVGDYSFVGGTLKVDRDVPPASRALGNPLKWASINLHALKRHAEDFPEERIRSIEKAYRELYRSSRPIQEVIEELKKSEEPLFKTFFNDSWRGSIIRP